MRDPARTMDVDRPAACPVCNTAFSVHDGQVAMCRRIERMQWALRQIEQWARGQAMTAQIQELAKEALQR